MNDLLLKFFKEGLRSVFRQWTGLELAVFHQWGGPSSTERAESLMEEVLGMFQGVDKIYKDVRQLHYINWTMSTAFAITHDEISCSLISSSQDISFVLEDYM